MGTLFTIECSFPRRTRGKGGKGGGKGKKMGAETRFKVESWLARSKRGMGKTEREKRGREEESL